MSEFGGKDSQARGHEFSRMLTGYDISRFGCQKLTLCDSMKDTYLYTPPDHIWAGVRGDNNP